jgi:hypothetical protein
MFPEMITQCRPISVPGVAGFAQRFFRLHHRKLKPGTASYVKVSTNLTGPWRTVATIPLGTKTFTFNDPDQGNRAEVLPVDDGALIKSARAVAIPPWTIRFCGLCDRA